MDNTANSYQYEESRYIPGHKSQLERKENLSPEFLKGRLENSFKEMIENMKLDHLEDTIALYMSPKMIQHVDGHILNYNDFIQHMRAQKGVLQSAKVYIDHIIVEGLSASTVHRVKAVKKDGNEIEAKVIAYYEFDQSGKVILIDEFTKILQGSKADQNIGSMK